jgi:transcriptional regulator with XRE-family HTH domain
MSIAEMEEHAPGSLQGGETPPEGAWAAKRAARAEAAREERERRRRQVLTRLTWHPDGRTLEQLARSLAWPGGAPGVLTVLQHLADDGLVHERDGVWRAGRAPAAQEEAVAQQEQERPSLAEVILAAAGEWMTCGELVARAKPRAPWASRTEIGLEVVRLREAGEFEESALRTQVRRRASDPSPSVGGTLPLVPGDIGGHADTTAAPTPSEAPVSEGAGTAPAPAGETPESAPHPATGERAPTLRSRREAAGLSRLQLATRMAGWDPRRCPRVPRDYIGQVERGHRSPSAEWLALADQALAAEPPAGAPPPAAPTPRTDIRDRLREVVTGQPGQTLKEVGAALGCGPTRVSQLVREPGSEYTVVRDGVRRRLYPSAERARAGEASPGHLAVVLAYVSQHPGCASVDVATHMGCSPSWARRCMTEAGCSSTRRLGTTEVAWYPPGEAPPPPSAPESRPGAYGDRVRAARLAAGLSQRQLAERSGLTQSDVSKVERGAHVPGPERVAAIEAVLGIAQPDAPASGLPPVSPTGRAHDGAPHCPPPPVEPATAQPSGEAAAEDAAHTAPEAGGSGEDSTSTSPGRERAAPEPASVGVHVVDGQPLWWCDEPDCELTAGHEEEHQDETGRRWLTGERAVAPVALHDYHRPGGWEVAALADVDALLAELAGVDTRPYIESERLDLLRELAHRPVHAELVAALRVLDLVLDADERDLPLAARTGIVVGELRALRNRGGE